MRCRTCLTQLNQDFADLIGDRGIVTRYKVLQLGSPNSARRDTNDQQLFILELDQISGSHRIGTHYNANQSQSVTKSLSFVRRMAGYSMLTNPHLPAFRALDGTVIEMLMILKTSILLKPPLDYVDLRICDGNLNLRISRISAGGQEPPWPVISEYK